MHSGNGAQEIGLTADILIRKTVGKIVAIGGAITDVFERPTAIAIMDSIAVRRSVIAGSDCHGNITGTVVGVYPAWSEFITKQKV